jgi:hypothetical protein
MKQSPPYYPTPPYLGNKSKTIFALSSKTLENELPENGVKKKLFSTETSSNLPQNLGATPLIAPYFYERQHWTTKSSPITTTEFLTSA